MALSSSALVEHLYQKKLPSIYREMDEALGTMPLKRYLDALITGGFSATLSDTEKLLQLVDPMKCPAEFVPYLCESFGLPYFEDIDVVYQRKFLMSIGEIYRRRGTYSCVRYLAKTLTGLEVTLYYTRAGNERTLNVVLLAKSVEEATNLDTSAKVIQRFLVSQIPFYITPAITSSVNTTILSFPVYRANSIVQSKRYVLS